MSAEVPTPNAEKPPGRSRVSNRRQMLLFAALTLILTIATVWGGRIWLRNSERLVFAAGDANGVEARFAAKLATVLNNNPSKLRLSPPNKKIKSLAELKKKKIAVLADGDHNTAFVRKVLEISDGSDAASAVQLASPNSP